MLHRPHQTAFLLLLSAALSVSAQGIPYEPSTPETRVDTLQNGATVEYVKTDSSTSAMTDSVQKPRTKLWHPVATGLGAWATGVCMVTGGFVVASMGSHEAYGTGPYEFPGLVLMFSGGVLGVGGELYAIIGGIYNATIPDEPPKKPAAQQFSISPAFSFSQNRKPQPGVIARVRF